ncbi:MAG: hypothetical protein CM1200mP29_09380 [Verrucomicrobiota bacterium]|nr:MAG: hypothetical protein CM1200mP29_09380 [Verrucomicrobiota bacterium]
MKIWKTVFLFLLWALLTGFGSIMPPGEVDELIKDLSSGDKVKRAKRPGRSP